MMNERIGNDLKVAWKIYNNGEYFSLVGKDVTVYLKTPFSKEEVKGFTIAGNVINWTFYGKDQKHTGTYSLELVINEGAEGMITTDKCNFVNLVADSCKVGGTSEPNLEIETIELTSNIEYIAGSGEGGGGSCDDTKIRTELAELSLQVGRVSKDVANKVDATYVDNAIASAITKELNSDF